MIARRTHLRGLLLAIIALVSQLALGSTVLPDTTQLAGVEALSVLCTGAPAAPDRPARHRHVDTALCPLSVALALPATIPTPPAVLAAPPGGLIVWGRGVVSARAPPSHVSHLGLPRGPPALV